MRSILISAGIAVLLIPLSGCTGEHRFDGGQQSQAQTGLIRPTKMVEADETPQWQRIVSVLDDARLYYEEHRTAANPAKLSDDQRMKARQSAAVDDVDALLAVGMLKSAEAQMLKFDIARETWYRYQGSRNVVGDNFEIHHDSFFVGSDMHAWRSLRQAMPFLEELAQEHCRNPVVISRILKNVEDDLAVVRQSDRIPYPEEIVRETVRRAQDLVAQIKRIHGAAGTRSYIPNNA